MQSPSRRHRQRLLGEAFEQGIRHFDVARMYGLGVAESEVGRFARGRREQIGIATKFGIEPSGPTGLARLQAPARAAIVRLPALREALKRRQAAFHEPCRYDAATVRASLETSLKALGTDYVDFLFVHDPGPSDRLDMAELAEALDDLKRAGHVRGWGVSGERETCVGLGEMVDDDAFVLQIRDDILDPALPSAKGDSPPITFGALSRALPRVLSHVSGNEERRSRWSRAVGVDCGQPEVLASLLLQEALDRNSGGMVLFSTTRPERVKLAMGAVDAGSAAPGRASSQAFRERVLAELGRGGVAHG